MSIRFYSSLALSCVLIAYAALSPVHAADFDHIRVRILEKYHPKAISISAEGKRNQAVLIDMRSDLPIEFRQADFHTLRLPGQSWSRNYSGRLLIDRENEELLIINTLPLEEYITSVVLSELGWVNTEAMRAQALLSRTWAITHLHPNRPYDFGDMTNSQVYQGLFPQSAKTRHRLTDTRGLVLIYRGEPIEALYHAACSDRVFSAYEIWGRRRIRYLDRVGLPVQLIDNRNDSRWERSLKKSDIARLFRKEGYSGTPLRLRQTRRDGQLGVYVDGQWVGIDDFRLQVNRGLGWNQLRSNDFVMQDKGDQFYFKGKGFGHLVGMCQRDAVTLAELGWDYKKILGLFYPGSELGSMYRPTEHQ